MALLRERITFGEGAELSGAISDEVLIAEMTRMVTSYLTYDPARVATTELE
jgi:hypothetical protein